ncbi:hypothetical protein [Gilliamella sp. Pas-s27]|uniref:hypothetical protein n=1 Tax=Gilliamella sp. Pas-s27 TaxID=2687311 RepID=UPI001365C217|nr:hypothetical protein [Gilliamella sp. Pas-s27]MWP47436.1 hypothetical protein [Gilliamella sp. Pas-s27]
MKKLSLLALILLAGAANAEQKELPLTAKQFDKGIKKYFNTIPQCAEMKVDELRLINDGANGYQEFNLGNVTFTVILKINEKDKLTNIQITSTGNAKNEQARQGMLCSTYSVMRMLQPKLASKDDALKQAGHLWVLAKDAPFEMTYYLDRIKAQFVPFELNVYTN